MIELWIENFAFKFPERRTTMLKDSEIDFAGYFTAHLSGVV